MGGMPLHWTLSNGAHMAKPNYNFEKRQRERKKAQKQEEKRQKKADRQSAKDEAADADGSDAGSRE